MPRKVLYQRVDRRVDEMFEGGLVEEAAGTPQYGSPPPMRPPCQSIGLQRDGQHLAGEATLEEAKERTKLSTHRLIRRQDSGSATKTTRLTCVRDADDIDMKQLFTGACTNSNSR